MRPLLGLLSHDEQASVRWTLWMGCAKIIGEHAPCGDQSDPRRAAAHVG